MKYGKYLALLLVVFALGCTSGGVTGGVGFSQTAGAVINDFNFDVQNVEDVADQAVLTFGFQNVGGKTMKGNTQAFIFGPALEEGSTATKIWEVKDNGGGKVEKNRITFTLNADQFFPPDTSTGQPGMSQLNRVVLIPPTQEEGMNNIPYTFEGELCYPYSTTSSSIVRSIAPNTFAQVASKKTLAETKDSAGPIQITLKAGENIRASVSGGQIKLPLVLEFRDVGGGFATRSDVACDPMVPRSSMGVVTAKVSIDGTEASCGTNEVFIRNGVGNLFCTGSFASNNPKNEFHIVATTDYNYYVTKSATISVSHSRSQAA